MNYDEMPNRYKTTSDGEETKKCWCSGRCYVSYEEDANYKVTCEHCGVIITFKAPSHDWAIKMFNDMPTPVGYDDSTKRNAYFKNELIKSNELRILRNFLDHMTKVYRQRHSNWVVVRDILMNGTSTAGRTSCITKCIELGIDPYGHTLDSEVTP